MAARVLSQVVAHQTVEPFESHAYLHAFDGDKDLRSGTEFTRFRQSGSGCKVPLHGNPTGSHTPPIGQTYVKAGRCFILNARRLFLDRDLHQASFSVFFHRQ